MFLAAVTQGFVQEFALLSRVKLLLMYAKAYLVIVKCQSLEQPWLNEVFFDFSAHVVKGSQKNLRSQWRAMGVA